ncbi:MAG: oligosaccharide flippase family protein, partial [Caulobacterales bacterium]|nr:oligosaccharide flippase family protein [Caulobacterales bacterium]
MSQNVPTSKRLVLINVAASGIAQLVSITGVVWANQHLIRRLSPEEYALYPPIMAIVLLAPVFTSIATGGVLRHITEAYAKGDEKGVTEVVSSIYPVILMFVAGLLALGGLAAWRIEALLNVYPDQLLDARLMMMLLVASQAVTLLLAPLSVGLHVRQKFVWLNIILLCEEALKLSLLFGLLMGVSTRVLWVVVALLAARVVGALITLIASRAVLPCLRFRFGAFHRGTARKLTRFGAWTMVGNLVGQMLSTVDAIILNRLSTPVQVTAFHVASLPDRQIHRFLSSVTMSVQIPLTALYATDRHDDLKRAYLRGNRYVCWFALAFATPLMVFAPELVTLYVGDAYIAAAMTAVLIYGTYPLTSATDLLWGFVVATGKISRYMTIVASAGVAKLILTFVLVGHFGMGAVGAALATWIATMFFEVFFIWPLSLKLLKITFREFLSDTLIPGHLPALVAAAAFFAMKAMVPADGWLVLGAEIAV